MNFEPPYCGSSASVSSKQNRNPLEFHKLYIAGEFYEFEADLQRALKFKSVYKQVFIFSGLNGTCNNSSVPTSTSEMPDYLL